MLHEIKERYEKSKTALETLGDYLNITQKKEKVRQLEAEIAEDSFWDNNDQAQAIFAKLNTIKNDVAEYEDLLSQCQEVDVYLQMHAEEASDESLSEAEAILNAIEPKLESVEIKALLSGKYDEMNCIVSINAGAGGTDAQDWAQMLLRMYTRWFDKKGFAATILDETMGDEAGLKSATIRVEGTLAYGFVKNEGGVHRLVRLSPFNANNKRQTSFAAVDVMPEITADFSSVDIDSKDLKIDTFRASGAGGQHVNKTDSAVRITHIPTGVVAQSQHSRSQGSNKDMAMTILKSRLLQIMESEHKSNLEEIRGVAREIAWGNQIRSYVFHPYKLVKDLRNNVETSDVGGVMDGDLDRFVNAQLRLGVNNEASTDG